MKTADRPILAAEDESSDALILSRVFRKAGIPNRLVVAKDGQEVVDYLLGNGPYQDREQHPLPVLLLLDLKMPRMSGFDVLARICTRPEFARLPVVILSSSSHEADVRKALQMGACDYLIKPQDLTVFITLIRRVYERWLGQPH